jgi:MauM/NapG family ferredoxin protein
VWTRVRSPWRLRPPGVAGESVFLSTCLRCSECMKICPTSGLQPAWSEAGLTGFWTPVLTPRLGYCDYACNACGQVCPSGAIPSLDLETKQKQTIGIAVIDRDRCLPWSQDVPCAVCQEMCPVPKKAIVLTGGRMVPNAQGGENWLTFPVVRAARCIGCGICEYQCPVQGRSAVRVYSQRAGLDVAQGATG